MQRLWNLATLDFNLNPLLATHSWVTMYKWLSLISLNFFICEMEIIAQIKLFLKYYCFKKSLVSSQKLENQM